MLIPNTLIHNRYRVVRLIGRGGMGAVYEAIDERLSSTIALKQTLVIDTILQTSETGADIDSQYIASLRKAFEREAQILAMLRHHALPKVMDYFSDEQGQFLVMEFIQGDDLAALLNRQHGPFPYEYVLDWADQLLDALDYLHTQPNPIVHRDIKPQNLKLTARNEIILLDFGLAKGSTSLHTRMTAASSVFGYTQQYAPLEQIRGTGTDPRSDLYALGATLYHLITGILPVDALARVDALVSRLPDPLKPPHELHSQVSPAISTLLMKALEISIGDRPARAAVLRADLKAARYGLTSPDPIRPPLILIPDEPDLQDSQTIAYPRQSVPPQLTPAVPIPDVVAETLPLNAVHDNALLSQPTSASEELQAIDRVVVPGSGQPPRRRGIWLVLAGTLVAMVLIGVATFSVNRGIIAWGTTPSSSSPIAGESGTASDPAQTSDQTTTALAQATAQAEQTAEAIVQATAQAEQTAEAIVQATAAAEQTAAVVAEEESRLIAEQRAAIAAELPARAAMHLLGEFGNATAQYDPVVEAGLLQAGYAENIINIGGGRGLQPSHTEPTRHTWVRDLDYAISGYGYVLGDMSVMRENIELFLADVESNGIVPDVYNSQSGYGLNQAWDSMPNLIHAMYIYVAKTGDRAFYQANREKCQWIGAWIANLDTDGDGLPDKDIFPYGYYNSIENSVRHTYALAKFYAAFQELAALDQAIGADGSAWAQRAVGLRETFQRPFDDGGYWSGDLAWPVGWRDSSQVPVRTLETFGVFEALRSGLISPSDEQYADLMIALNARLTDLMAGPMPMRLALSGYPPELVRPVVREAWKADASAPWIVGLAAPAYATAGYEQTAYNLLDAYASAASANDFLLPQLLAVDDSGQEGKGGAWSSAAWFMAVYGGHYGLMMTPAALVVQPQPFTTVPDDGIGNLSYQGATIQFSLDPHTLTYRIQANRLTSVILKPMGRARLIQVNGGSPVSEAQIILQPDEAYVVVSIDES